LNGLKKAKGKRDKKRRGKGKIRNRDGKKKDHHYCAGAWIPRGEGGR
jgi:hypothetical protein